jgi:hypothetical protein
VLALSLVTVSADFSLNDGFHLGAEYTLSKLGPLDKLSLRAGLLTRTGLGLSVGLGISFSTLQIDYAFLFHPDFEGSHWLLSKCGTIDVLLFGLSVPADEEVS